MKKLLFTLAIGLATLTSCESDLVSAPPSDSNGGGVLLKKEILTYGSGGELTANYTYEGNRLMKIEDSDGEVVVYTYTDDLLTRMDVSGGAYTEYSIFEYNSDNKINKEVTSYTGGATQTNSFSYDENGTVTKTEDVGSGAEVVHVYTFSNGNLVTKASTSPSGAYSYTYIYDGKNNAGNNIYQANTFALLGYFSTPNNQLSCTQTSGADMGTSDDITTYTYNTANYPLTSINVYASGQPFEETTTAEYFYE